MLPVSFDHRFIYMYNIIIQIYGFDSHAYIHAHKVQVDVDHSMCRSDLHILDHND